MDSYDISPQDILKESVETTNVSILIVDDDSTNRFVLQTMLQKAGHTVYAADDGYEAVETYKAEQPDMVLMDVMMPGMDGYEATKAIKSLVVDDYVPVIFLTALSDEQALAKCIDSGGDDFLSKPYKKDLLNAKLQAHIRLKHLYTTAKKQRDALQEHNEREFNEQLLAQQVYRRMVHAGCLDQPNIKTMMSSLALFNGDVLFGAQTPSGMLHIMLGDFTGHGLSAAIGAVPLANVFYTMTSKGFGISDIVSEMNRKLKALLPVGTFCAACIYELDQIGSTLRIWNGGIPGAYVCNSDNSQIIHIAESKHMPLGILSDNKFDSASEVIDLSGDELIYLCTDGITEARSPSGEMFGNRRLEGVLSRGQNHGSGFEALREALKDYCQDSEQEDDMTLIEVKVTSQDIELAPKNDQEQAHPEKNVQDAVANAGLSEELDEEKNTDGHDWGMSITIDISTLRNVDPIPLLNQLVVDLSCNAKNKQEIFLVLSELITNSIDHGILELDSKIKHQSEGVAIYYGERQRQLEQMQEGWVYIDMKHQRQPGKDRLHIHIKDSGQGFDFKQKRKELETNSNPDGRGIPLVEQLCESIEYLGKGNEVRATYLFG
ncbi:MAG: response regulator [Gammaproteobacteria bacterium]|nr:MAG: response regulator [Gammaproteobacteria bacterium]